MLLDIHTLSKSFDRGKVKALQNVSLRMEAGRTYSILGESGSGKTTLARLIAGLEIPDSGEIHYQGRLISSESVQIPAEKRGIGFMFQHYALFPHLTIARNIAYGISKLPNKQDRVKEMLALVGLAGYEKRYPHELSGGQQQRVALARALAMHPKLLLLDEPFSNLDPSLRSDLRSELFTILQQTGVCSVFITHNAEDAMAISDEVLVLKKGQLQQQASPEVLYQQPGSPYVARIFGPLVELPAELVAAFGYAAAADQQYYLRSHHLQVDGTGDFQLPASLQKAWFMGQYHQWEVEVSGHQLQIHAADGAGVSDFQLGWNREQLLVFPKKG